MGPILSLFRADTDAAEPSQSSQPEVKANPVVSDQICKEACFGAGCYWGTEKFFKKNFSEKFPDAMINGEVGFMGQPDSASNPTYQEVCSGNSGHVEVFHLEYKGGEEMYEKLVRFFFQFHDPSKLNMQGNDKGTQYASVIFCYDDIQEKIARKVKEELEVLLKESYLKCYFGKEVFTDIRRTHAASPFFAAHQEHQNYLANNPKGYCNHKIRFQEWPTRQE